MTLREALEALHQAGRIRSVWLPGMATTAGWRCIDFDPDGGRFLWATGIPARGVESWWAYRSDCPEEGPDTSDLRPRARCSPSCARLRVSLWP
jgi:hypothetical protein